MNKNPMIERHNIEEARGAEYLKYIRSINMLMSKAEICAQLAEECNELAHAALKLRRTLIDTNPTPVTYDEAQHMVGEELADIALCVDALRYKMDGVRQIPLECKNAATLTKAERWVRRLEDRDEQ